jgi:hypothetical protein
MELTGQTNRRIIIFSLAMIILPLVAFPARLGTDLAKASLITALYELAFYSVVLFVFHRRTSLLKLVQGAGVCLVYRLALGAAFGLLMAAVYSMQLRVSLTLGMSGYLPAILFHVALAPLALKPALDQLFTDGGPKRRAVVSSALDDQADLGRTSLAVSKERPARADETFAPKPVVSAQRGETTGSYRTTDSAVLHPRVDHNGFDRAVNYIGEHGSVHLATVLDDEGLVLGAFRRGSIDPEDWAPLALLLVDGGNRVLSRGQMTGLEKMDLVLKEKRLVVARPDGCHLMVLADRHDDELLNIRINQSLDMINKFVAERYGEKLNPNAERIHVPSA